MPKRKHVAACEKRLISLGCNFTMPKRKLNLPRFTELHPAPVATLPCQSGNRQVKLTPSWLMPVATLPCQSGNRFEKKSTISTVYVATLPCQSGNIRYRTKRIAAAHALQLYHAKAETRIKQIRRKTKFRCNFTMPKRKHSASLHRVGGARVLQLYHAKAETIYHRMPTCPVLPVATLPCQSGNHRSLHERT